MPRNLPLADQMSQTLAGYARQSESLEAEESEAVARGDATSLESVWRRKRLLSFDIRSLKDSMARLRRDAASRR